MIPFGEFMWCWAVLGFILVGFLLPPAKSEHNAVIQAIIGGPVIWGLVIVDIISKTAHKVLK